MEPIAVVGIGCRFPADAHNPEALWSLLSEGRSAWQDVPTDRYNWKSFFHPSSDINGTMNHRGGHFLNQDVSMFDAAFFGISPTEAHATDPQQRIQLETAYEALENAGIALEHIKGSDTAVFVATSSSDYEHMMFKDTNNFAKYHMIGCGNAIVSNRISYFFDLKGPSITLDTACSGSLVALHQACEVLRAKTSKLALVGGTNLILSPDPMIHMSLLHLLNSEGRSYSFDSRGSGYGRGEGAATIVLKRLNDALKEGDPIRAIIRGTGTNQDGKTNGITSPSQEAQECLIASVYSRAGLDPRDTGYVEAHGTGTVIGDTTEVNSIINSFCTGRKTPLLLGSIKANLGHLESASGLAGLIEAILVLENGYIPPSVNLVTMKENLNLETSKIIIPRKLEPWPVTNLNTRYASVNSFGYGGTNAHAILQMSPTCPIAPEGGCPSATEKAKTTRIIPIPSSDIESPIDAYDQDSAEQYSQVDHSSFTNVAEQVEPSAISISRIARLITMTAYSEGALRKMIANLAKWVTDRDMGSNDLRDLAYTLSSRRSLMTWRCAIIASGSQDFATMSQGKDTIPLTRASKDIQITFVFTGQGAQWESMGKALILLNPIFKESISKSSRILQDLKAPWSLMEEILLENEKSRLHESAIAQPCVTAIQIALVDLFEHLHVRPSIVLGHSSGEIAAAYAARIVSHAEALRIAYNRGLICNQYKGNEGAMLAVGLGEGLILKHISHCKTGKLSVACINSPSSTTVSGDKSDIVELKSFLDSISIRNKILDVNVAYHSSHMQKVAGRYHESLESLNTGTASSVRFFSSVTGVEKTSDFGSSYWVQNLVSKVRFSEALETVCRSQARSVESAASKTLHVLVELGPHSALAGPINQTLKQLGLKEFDFLYLPSLVRGEDAIHSIMRLVAKLFENGHPLNFRNINAIDGSSKPFSVVKDIPPYPWDHSRKYWHESEASKADRFRQHPYHDLLGLRITGGASYGRHWRHLIDLDKLPWLREHVVDEIVTFPAAGYICMVLQGVSQIVQERGTKNVLYELVLSDVVFVSALMLPEPPAVVEVQLSLLPSRATTSRESTLREDFFISSTSSNGIRNEHCRGVVTADFSSDIGEVQDVSEEALAAKYHKQLFEEIIEQCTEELDAKTLYEMLQKNGNSYGSNFAILNGIQLGSEQAVSKLTVPDVAACMPSGFMQPHIIHPTTLDAVLQICVPLLLRHSALGSIMPVALKSIAISPNINAQNHEQLKVGARIYPLGPRVATADIVALQLNDQSEMVPVITITQAELMATGTTQAHNSDPLLSLNTICRLDWGPDVDNLMTSELTPPRPEAPSDKSQLAVERKDIILEKAAALYIQRCLERIGGEYLHFSQPHMAFLLTWMKDFSSSASCRAFQSNLNAINAATLVEEVQEAGVEGEALVRVGEKLWSILEGKVDPLSLLLEDDLLYRMYLDDSSSQCCSHLVKFVAHLIYKNPHLTILEIGAGTGGATLPLLQSLGEKRSSISRYDYTDISSGFFESVRSKLSEWSDILQFKVLDIERDPLDQGFEKDSYDLIIASNSLHATRSIDGTLGNLRKLLKPRGRLALIEITRLVPYFNLIVGILPGWWRGVEDGRQKSPLLSVEQWNSALLHNSFTGIEVSVRDFESPASRSAMMVSSVSGKRSATTLLPVEILLGRLQNKQCQAFPLQLSLLLKERGIPNEFTQWPLGHVCPDTIYLIFDACENSVLAGPSQEQFSWNTSLAIHGRHIIWVTLHEKSAGSWCSGGGLVKGFARVAQSENDRLKFVTFDVQHKVGSENSKLANAICNVIMACFGMEPENGSYEVEYAYQDDQLLIPRLVPDARISSYLQASTSSSRTEMSPFHQAGRPLKLHVGQPGLLDSLVFVDDNLATEPLHEDELTIHVMACGINFKDVFIALGQMKAGTRMTGECAGTIIAVGSNVQTRFRVGDRVCAWNGTAFASCARVNGDNAYILPKSISLTVGASIPVNFLTAYYCLIEVSKLRKGQTILIHAASGGVGQAALMLAQHIGAEIFATAGSASKRRLLAERYSIEESHLYSSRSRAFKKAILRLTQGRGLDVILNSLSGIALEDSWDCVATFGTFVEIGKTDIYRKARITMEPFDKNTTFASVDLTAVATHKPQLMRSMMAAILSMFASGSLKPVASVTTMPMTDIESAFRLIQARKHTGKIILTADSEDAKIKTVRAQSVTLRLEENGTYLVAGALGDIGRNICQYMAGQGAKHIVMLSRKQLKPKEQHLIQKSIASRGAQAHIVVCDISDANRLQEVADWCGKTLPPVKGIIQAAMVLQDRTLEKMTVADFKMVLEPKVNGTNYLSKTFADSDLDFFIMLSSTTSFIGSRGQANYAAASTFQDSVAQSMSESGTHYMSLDVGMVDDSSVIASHVERRQNLMRHGIIPLKMEHVMAIVGYAMSPQAKRDGCRQLAIGLDRQSLSTHQDPRIPRDGVFSHLGYRSGQKVAGEATRQSGSVDEAIKGSKNAEEVSSVIAQATIRHICALVALEHDDTTLDTPIADLGLDSLIAIDLRNWIARNLQAAIQTSEIFDAPNLRTLVHLVSSRSPLVLAYQKEALDDVPQQNISTSEDHRTSHTHLVDVQNHLPTTPLPQIEETMELYLYSVRVLLPEDELRRTSTALENFLRPGGFGKELQSRLVKRAGDSRIDSWLYDLYTAHEYLRRRSLEHYFGSHVASPIHHSQAERAAIICAATFNFQQRLEAGVIEPDYLNDQPLCMDSLNYLFSSCRIPHAAIDQLHKFPGNKYSVALRHGHYYKISLQSENQPVPLADLEAIFKIILNRQGGSTPSIAALTACDRDHWAKVRLVIRAESENNRTLMDMIEAAAFVVCLDDASPSDPSQRANQFLLGKTSDRWADKILQFVVCQNGASAYLCEHSAVDGGTLIQLNEAIRSAILEPNRTSPGVSNLDNHSGELPGYIFDSNSEIEKMIDCAQRLSDARNRRIEYYHFTCSSFGSTFSRDHRCAPKAAYQLVIQLASLRYFGYQPGSWEAITMRPFRKGRVELIQAVLPPVAEFCASMQNRQKDSAATQLKRALFYNAIKAYNNTMTRISRGGGFMGHLYALQEVLEEGEETPQLFLDPSYEATRPKKIITSTIPWQDSLQEAGSDFFLSDPEHIWIQYEVGDESCRFSIQGPVGRTNVFYAFVRAAAEELKCLLKED